MLEALPERKLETMRCVLEPLVVAHAGLLFGSLQAEQIYTFIPEDPPRTVADLQTRYARWAARRSPTGDELWLNWAIRFCPGGPYAGTLQATIRSDQTALMAYLLFPDYWRQGIARECCRVLIDYLFTGYGMKRIIAQVDTRNEASWRLLAALGFSRIRLLPNADEFKGTTSDEYVYELGAPAPPLLES